MDEEIKVRLGLDASGLESGLRKTNSQMANFDELSNKGFVSAGSAGKAFKKSLSDISDQSGIMGGALKFALSPAVGLLSAVAVGFAFLGEKVKEINKYFDDLRDKAAKPFGDAQAALDAVKKRQDEIKQGHQNFENSQNAKNNPVIVALEEENKVREKVYALAKELREKEFEDRKRKVEDAGEVDQKDQMRKLEDAKKEADRAAQAKKDFNERNSIKRALGKLAAESSDTRTEVGDMEDASVLGAESTETMKTNAAKQAEILQQNIKDIEAKLPRIREKWASFEADRAKFGDGILGTIRMGVAHTGDIFDSDMFAENAPNKLAAELKHYKDLLEQTKKSLEGLTAKDKESNAELEAKRKKLSEITSEIARLTKRLNDLPEGSGPGAKPRIDPATGGIAYVPLKDKGGIAYKPIKGAPGYTEVKPGQEQTPEPKTVEQQLKEMTDHLATLVALSQGVGLNTVPAMAK